MVLCIAVAIASSSVPAYAADGTAVTVKIGSKKYDAVFYDNDTARTFLRKTPVTYRMTELNGNEKYRYLSYDLPEKVGKIKAGDIMLYGTDCIVVFYKSFETPYEYTRIGRITDTSGLKNAAGTGSVKVRFSKKKDIHLNSVKLTLKAGKTGKLKLIGAKADKIKWTSSDKRIAVVSNGKIKAKKEGKAVITAKYRNKKYKCKVTVISGLGGKR